MRIEQDSLIDQRWLVTPSPDGNPTALLDQKSMKAAMVAAYGPETAGLNDVWFQPYAAKRLARFPDAKPLLRWLKKHSARHFWQASLSTVETTFASPSGGWESLEVLAAFADYQVALILLDRDIAALFKLALPTLVPETPDEIGYFRRVINPAMRDLINA